MNSLDPFFRVIKELLEENSSWSFRIVNAWSYYFSPLRHFWNQFLIKMVIIKKVYIYFDFHSQQGFQHVHILFIACYQLPYFCSWLSHFYQSSKKSRGVSKTWCHETKLGQFEPNTLSIFVIEWNPMILIDFFYQRKS